MTANYVGTELELFQHAHRWKRYLARQIGPFLQGEVLEVGAGLGGTTALLWRAGLGRWTCLEPDRELAARIEGRRGQDGFPADVAVVAGTLADLPEAARFDCALYVDVLEHIEDDRLELSSVLSRLRPGGRLLVMSPAHPWLFSPFDAAIGHHRRYTKASLEAVVPAALRRECLRYLDSAGLLASAANRLLMRQAMPGAGQLAFWDRVLVPVSTVLDRLLLHAVGKSVLGVWRVPADAATQGAAS